MALTTYVVTEFWIAYVIFFLTMVLIAMRISPFQALSTQLIKSDNRGSLMSLLVAIGQVGYGIGGSVAGPFYVESGYASNTFMGTIMILIMAYVVWKHVPEPDLNTKSSTEPEPSPV